MEKSDDHVKSLGSLNPPSRVVIDNDFCEGATLIKVRCDCRHDNRRSIILQLFEVLCEMSIVVIKAYISWDGESFHDAFVVTDLYGNKIRDQNVIVCIQKGIESEKTNKPDLSEAVRVVTYKESQMEKAKLWTQLISRKVDLNMISNIRDTIFESCLYVVLPADTTVSSLLASHIIFKSPKQQNTKRNYQTGTGKRCRLTSTRVQNNVRVAHSPRVYGKGLKLSRIK